MLFQLYFNLSDMNAEGQQSGVFVKSLSFAHGSVVLSIFFLNVPSGLTVGLITGVLLSGVLEVFLFFAMSKKTKTGSLHLPQLAD